MTDVQVHLLDGHQLTVDENDRIASSSIQALNGLTATPTQLNYLSGVTPGVGQANKALVLSNTGSLTSGLTTLSVATQLNVNAIVSVAAGDPINIAPISGAQGGNTIMRGGTSTTSGNNGGIVQLVGGGAGATGIGGAANVVATAGGATSGTGGSVTLQSGAGSGGNANGGSVIINVGAANGTGAAGTMLVRGRVSFRQTAETAKTVSATLTAAEILAGIITVNQGAGAASALQLPTAAAMDAALPDFTTNDSFRVSIINTSTVAAESASVTTNTGWTLVGGTDFPAYSASGSLNSFGGFVLRKTGASAWTAYRVA